MKKMSKKIAAAALTGALAFGMMGTSVMAAGRHHGANRVQKETTVTRYCPNKEECPNNPEGCENKNGTGICNGTGTGYKTGTGKGNGVCDGTGSGNRTGVCDGTGRNRMK